MNTSSFVASTPRRLIAALVAAGALGAASVGLISGHQARASAPVPAPMVAQAALPAGAALPSFAQITAQNGPAVVNISVTGSTRGASLNGDDDDEQPTARQQQQKRQAPGLDPDDPFYEFFRRFGVPGAGGGAQPNVPTHGQGSGFIVSPDGLVLTNAHVVKGASEVVVKLTDRREFRAKVLGADPKTDVAVLKIDAKNLPTVRLGSTRDLQVGEWVLAIGGLALLAMGWGAGGSLTGFTPASTTLLVYLALLSSAAFSLWSLLLKHNRVSQVTVFNFTVPIFGAALSAVFLGEALWEWKNLVALVLVCGGIWLVTRDTP